MAMITSSEYGVVAVNNSVLSKLIIDNMLSMESEIVPCNRKGRPLKKGVFTGYNELYNAVELKEIPEGIYVTVYYLTIDNARYQETSDSIFDKIESDFELLCLDKPLRITANIKGILIEKKTVRKDVEMVRKNVIDL